MPWILIAAVAVATGIVALIVVTRVKRAAHVNDLGCVSNHWIAEHSVDWL
jgi:hypothetical protein